MSVDEEYQPNPKLDENRAYLDNNTTAHIRTDILKILELMGADLRNTDIETLSGVAAILQHAQEWGHIQGQNTPKDAAEAYQRAKEGE